MVFSFFATPYPVCAGNVFNSTGAAAKEGLDAAVRSLQRNALYFLLLGIAAFTCTFFEYALAAVSSEKQVRRIREEYLAALLRQDMVWYDTGSPGEVAAHLAEDTVLIQAGIGERATEALRYVTTAVAGIIIGFIKDPALTGVVLAFVPLIVASGTLLRLCTLRYERRSQDAYARASDVANEAISNIRTVAAFGAEKREVDRYVGQLHHAEEAGTAKGFYVGSAVGCFYLALFSAYAVSLRYGAQRIISSRTEHPECRFDPTLGVCFSGGNVSAATHWWATNGLFDRSSRFSHFSPRMLAGDSSSVRRVDWQHVPRQRSAQPEPDSTRTVGSLQDF